jgi:hypothetical protein
MAATTAIGNAMMIAVTRNATVSLKLSLAQDHDEDETQRMPAAKRCSFFGSDGYLLIEWLHGVGTPDFPATTRSRCDVPA